MSDIPHNLLVFGRLLRHVGVEVHVGRLLDVTEALQHVDIGVRDDVFHTCRALLVHRQEDLALFDRAFEAFFGGVSVMAPNPGDGRHENDHTGDRHPDAGSATPASSRALGEEGGTGESGALHTWSDAGALGTKGFSEFTSEEVALARAALDRLVWTPGLRRTRRWGQGRGTRVDLRRALARSLRTGGDVLTLPRRRRHVRSRPLVLLCDISGSMERYSRMLLHFAHAIVKGHRLVEAFLFSTELTRITRHLRSPRLDEAVTSVSQATPDWAGGTRIGEAIRKLHQEWGRRALRSRSVVLLISDGWDRGDPLLLRDQIARLQRSCHRLIWLNPLIGTAGYEPLTRGLQAALPFVDDFLPVRTLTNLADLAVHLNTLSAPSRTSR